MERIDRPVFVIGVDHSGTSILYRMLAHHPDFAWFNQLSLRDGSLPGRTRVPFHGWIMRTSRRLIGFRWVKRERVFLPHPREGIGIWRRLIPVGQGFLDETDHTEELAGRVRGAIRAELDAWRLERMLVKIPYLTRAVRLLDRIFPDALFVHIVRDGRAVAVSTRRLYGREDLEPREALRSSALCWAETIAHVDRAADRLEGRLLTLRYEAFCTDVHGWLQQIFRFAGLDPERADLGSLPRTLEPTNDVRLRTCSDEERHLLDELLAPALRRWAQ